MNGKDRYDCQSDAHADADNRAGTVVLHYEDHVIPRYRDHKVGNSCIDEARLPSVIEGPLKRESLQYDPTGAPQKKKITEFAI